MAILDIVTYPDPFLKQPTQPVTEFGEALAPLLEDMADTMYEAPGVGLAANQVGKPLRLLIYDPQPDPEVRNFRAVINPEIVEKEGSFLSEEEGCLSVPEFRANVKRFSYVKVEAQDQDGNPIVIEASDFEAVILQHEIDHLDGVLFIDRISALKRQMYKKKVDKLIRKGEY